MNLPLRRFLQFGRNSKPRRPLWTLLTLVSTATGLAQDVQPSLHVQSLADGRVQISWPKGASAVVLEQTTTLEAPSQWQSFAAAPQLAGDTWVVTATPENQARFFRLRQEVPTLIGIAETSPSAGETGVAVTREVLFRFSAPLSPESVLSSAGLFAEYGGRHLLSRTELSGDRRSATLFLLENMPASSLVRVTLEAAGLYDATGGLVDTDGDGVAGGRRVLEFSTAGTAGLPGTSVFGKVYASEKNPDGSNKPLENVTITVDGAEETLRTTTDAAGGFVLSPAPAGRFFVHVDGRTASGSQWPGGAYYPFVGKAWDAVAGSTNNPVGGSGEVFLPRIVEGTLQSVSSTVETKITFSPSILAANPSLKGVEINVPPNSLFSDNGARGGKMGIVPVPSNRLPEPLPDGLNFPLVITVQTDGGSNFDRPVPVQFPNLPDPITGQKLPPGAKTALWSFNHDTGRWEVQGSMTISADGLFAVSDAGVGIRQPGWHGSNPGSSGSGPEGCEGDDCDGPKCGAYPPSCCADWPTFRAPCQQKQDLALTAIKDLAIDDALLLLGGTGEEAVDCGIGVNISHYRVSRDCAKLGEGSAECAEATRDGVDGGLHGCIPVIGSILGLYWSGKPVIDGYFNYSDCLKTLLAACGSTQARSGAKPAGPVPIGAHEPRLQRALDDLALQQQLSSALKDGYTKILGTPVWSQVESPEGYQIYHSFMQRLSDAGRADSPGGRQINAEERAELLAMPRPNQATDSDVQALFARLEGLSSGALANNPALRAEVVAGLDLIVEALEAVQFEGWVGMMDGFRHAVVDLASMSQPSRDKFPKKALDYRLHDLDSGFVRRGKLSSSGQFEGLILRPNTLYSLAYFDSESGKVGGTFFFSKNPGEATEVPTAPMLEDPSGTPESDQDADGLSDRAEKVLGTSLTTADSDGDGVPDGLEVRMGGNPLDGVGLPMGVVATSPTPGEATKIAASKTLAVVGCEDGLAVFDISNPRTPVRVSLTPGKVSAIALRGQTALVSFSSGLWLLDLTQPAAPNILWKQPALGVSQAVAFSEAFALVQNPIQLSRVDLSSGALIQSIPVSDVEDLLVNKDVVYLLAPNKLTVVRNGEVLEALATLNAAGFGGAQYIPRRLAIDGSRLYAGHNFGFNVFDITDPLKPLLVKDVKTAQAGWRQLLPAGGGQALAVVGPSTSGPFDVSLYRFTENGTNVQFVSTFKTPGQSASIAIAGGRAYVADGLSGLSILNFLQPDLAGVAPTVSVTVDSLVTPPKVENGRLTRITANAQDDVAVAFVDFVINGIVAARDDAYPFELLYRIPPVSPENTTFRVRARATDMSGNTRESEEVVLPVVTDATPPQITAMFPAPNSTILPGAIRQLDVTFGEPLLQPLPSLALGLRSTGADRKFDTADDVVIAGTVLWKEAERVLRLETTNPLGAGRYRLTVAAGLADLSANTRSFPVSWEFSTGPAPQLQEFFPPQNYVRVGELLDALRYTFDQPLPEILANTFHWTVSRKVNGDFVPFGPIEVTRSVDGRVFTLRTTPGFAPGEYRVSGEGPNVQSILLPFTFRNVPNEAVSTSVGAGTGLQTNWKYQPGPAVNDELLVNLPGQLARIETAKVKSITAFSDIQFHNQTIQIPTPILANAGLEMSGNTQFGTGTTEVRGPLRVINAAFRLGAHILNVYGGSVMENADIRFEHPDGALINHPASLMTLSNLTVALSGTKWSDAGRFINLGTLQALGGPELTPVIRIEDVRMRNDGRIEVHRGGLKFNSLDNEGVVDLAPETQLILPVRMRGGVSSRITGSGSVEFGELNPSTQSVLSAADAEIKGDIDPALALKLQAGKLSVYKPFIRPAGTIELRNSSLFQAFGPVTLGTLSLLDGDLVFHSDATVGTLSVVNRSSLRSVTQTRITGGVQIEQGFEALGPGVVEFAGTTIVSNNTQNAGIYVGNATLRNAGTWLHAVNNSQASVFSVLNENGQAGSGKFENTGIFEQVTTRPIAFQAPVLNRGRMSFKGATVSFDARKNVAPQRFGAYLPGEGAELVLQDTIVQHDFAGTLDLAAGSIRGTGIITALDAASSPKIINRGKLQPGAPAGALTIRATGGFEQTAAGEVAVTLSSEGHGQLLFNGTAAKLGGTLRITLADGYNPALDTVFPVLVAGSLEGTFSTVVLPQLGAGRKCVVEYTADQVRVKVVAN